MRPILLLLVALGLLPAPASAATVAVTTIEVADRGGIGIVQRAEFDATPGEANDLTLTRDASSVTFRDAGASIIAGTGCVAADAHTVRCSFRVSAPSMNVELGDGDDRAQVNGPGMRLSAYVDGGDGADVLDAGTAGDGGLALSGGAGDDRLLASASTATTLYGRDGNDVLAGGPGDNHLDGGPGDDRIDGGPGRDTLTYEEREGGVRVDLALGSGGAAGERDALTGIERVDGTSGPDTLLGGPAAETLNGYQGRDVIDGRDGDDRLAGYAGGDTLTGGPGRDTLDGSSGSDTLDGGQGDDTLWPGTPGRSGDRIACGSGADGLNAPSRWPLPLIPADCERLDTNLVRLRGWSIRAGSLRADIGLGTLFRHRGRCTLALRTARDGTRVPRLRNNRFRAVRLRVPRVERVTLRVTPVSRCQDWDRPLLIRLTAARSGSGPPGAA